MNETGVWEMRCVDGSRHLVDLTRGHRMRLPGLSPEGNVHLDDSDFAWLRYHHMEPVTMGEPAVVHKTATGDCDRLPPVLSWRPLPGAVALANGSVIVHSGTIPHVHEPSDCEPGPHRQAGCWIHRPSDHVMSDWPVLWDDIRVVAERLCEHGLGHPDPDHLAYAMEFAPRPGLGEHGCDGCGHGDVW